jgi:hypothetical protein
VDPCLPPAIDELARWVARSGRDVASMTPLAGDVSPRRYFRVGLRDGGTVILAWYPPEQSDRFEAFLATSSVLEQIGVRAPRVLERDAQAWLMLLEDGGRVALADLPCDAARVERLYRRGLDYAARIAALDPAAVPASNPPLDEAFLRRELGQTWQVFLDRELADDAGLRRELAATLDALCAELGRCPLAPCHRDLMARNLLVLQRAGEDELLVLDHQDLRLGPPRYDTASLLHDSTRLSPEQVARLENETLAAAERVTYARVCAQRLFKIVGTFHAFAARGHARHLGRVPTALRDAVDQLRYLPEGANVIGSLQARWGRPA